MTWIGFYAAFTQANYQDLDWILCCVYTCRVNNQELKGKFVKNSFALSNSYNT